MTPMTPRAFDAIVSQLTTAGAHEATVCADINGIEREWFAFFDLDDDHDGGIDSRHECCAYTRATLIGAWAEDDAGNLYAGNRAELAEWLGADEVQRWERIAEDNLNG